MLDVFIIGSGPAGLSAALYAKRAGLKLAIADKMFGSAGQIADSSHVENYLGINDVSGYELGEKFRNHVKALGVDFLEENVVRLSKLHDYWKIDFESENEAVAKTVIFAGGCRYRTLGIENEQKFIGRGISYCAACDGAFFKNKTVVVVGGGNTAFDEALYLSDICKKVYLINRRSEFRGLQASLKKIEQKENIEIIKNATVEKLNGNEKLEEIVLQTGQSIKTDGLFLAIGMIPQTEILLDLECRIYNQDDSIDRNAVKRDLESLSCCKILDENGYVIADENCITKAGGLFVAGDARTKKLRQAVTAVADGANAVEAVIEYLK